MLILASASPRRHELLTGAQINHVVRAASVDETRYPGEAPDQYVKRVASDKAAAIDAGAEDIVLGADTVVCVQGEVLGKPANEADAVRMLRTLSGCRHSVFTGIALRRGDTLITDVAETFVWFDEISDDQLLEYVATGEPMDKAGSYAIQGYASRFVKKIEGCYHNVVGLPISLVYRHLKSL